MRTNQNIQCIFCDTIDRILKRIKNKSPSKVLINQEKIIKFKKYEIFKIVKFIKIFKDKTACDYQPTNDINKKLESKILFINFLSI